MDKIYLLSDMNSFYASVECLYNPTLRTVPMAVCGDPAMRHGIILAKNDLAKKAGIVTGESIFNAKKKEPNLITVTADYPKYVEYAKKSRALYNEYSDEVIPFGLDEAWINLTGRVNSIEEGRKIADELRERIKSELGLTASIGVSFNYIYSKLASDMKKPDATTVLSRDDLQTVIWNLPAFELLFVGAATRRKLKSRGILTIGDIAQCDIKFMKNLLGKNGETLWRFSHGDDRDSDPKTPEDDPFKSMGNTVTMPYDLTNEIDILSMLYILSRALSARLEKHGVKAACVSILIKYSDFSAINRQLTVDIPINKEREIYKHAKKLFINNYNKQAVRSVGVSVSHLKSNKSEQLTLLDDNEEDDISEIYEIETNLRGKLKEIAIDKSSFSFLDNLEGA